MTLFSKRIFLYYLILLFLIEILWRNVVKQLPEPWFNYFKDSEIYLIYTSCFIIPFISSSVATFCIIALILYKQKYKLTQPHHHLIVSLLTKRLSKQFSVKASSQLLNRRCLYLGITVLEWLCNAEILREYCSSYSQGKTPTQLYTNICKSSFEARCSHMSKARFLHDLPETMTSIQEKWLAVC